MNTFKKNRLLYGKKTGFLVNATYAQKQFIFISIGILCLFCIYLYELHIVCCNMHVNILSLFYIVPLISKINMFLTIVSPSQQKSLHWMPVSFYRLLNKLTEFHKHRTIFRAQNPKHSMVEK